MSGETRRFRVTGKVQGVGFRWFVREQARTLGLAGWVRNEEDGSVLVRAHGTTALLDGLERALRAGPHGSRVESVSREVEQGAPSDGALPFPFVVDRNR